MGNPQSAAKLALVEEAGKATQPGGRLSLIVDRGARVAIVEGGRVELPPRLFALLAVLAERPGQPTSSPELISRLWEKPWGITQGHVRWHVWRLRNLLGDDSRDHPIIGNRRGHGYALELSPEAVRVVDQLFVSDDAGGWASEITGDIRREDAYEGGVEREELTWLPRDTETDASGRQRARRWPALVAANLVAVLMLGSGWFAVSRFSQRDVAESAPPLSEDAGAKPLEKDRVARPQEERDGHTKNNRKGKASVRDEIAQPASDGDSNSSETTVKGSRIERKGASGSKESDDSVPPRPTSQLYHLHNPETGDHFMTTSSSESNQKQAAGYTVTMEGRVFSEQVKGTVAIALDTSTTYIYRDASSNPDDGTTITKLYRLDKEDDYFYTSSSSAANQAEAQGWARTVVGYVAA